MEFQIGLSFIAISSIIYNILLIINKPHEEVTELKKVEKLKKWEKITTFFVMTCLLSIILYFILKFKQILNIYSFIYYATIFCIYISILMNILLKKDDKKITKDELSRLTILPCIFAILFNTSIGQYFFRIIKDIYGNSILYYILKQNTKYFILFFFSMINFFLILLQIKDMVHIKKREKKYILFDEDYIYKNARGKNGINFIKNYFKDICIFIKLKIIAIVQGVYVNSFKYIFQVFIKILKKLTNNFSVYVIIMKTFSISVIASLLITYYKLLNSYSEDIVTEFYAVIITTIIIPIILNIVAELKKN